MTMGNFHYTKNTVSAKFWCNSCYKETEHRIDDGRRGPCMNPEHGRQSRLIDTSPPAAEQTSMFEDSPARRKDRG